MPILLYLFRGGCSIFSESMYLIVSLLVLLSFLSLSLFSAVYWWVFASASETNRSSLTEFLLQQGQGGYIQREGKEE